MSEIASVIIVQKPFAEQINRCFLCNGNTVMKWQCGCMIKVNINLQILEIVSSLKRIVKLQPGRYLHTAFQTGMM